MTKQDLERSAHGDGPAARRWVYLEALCRTVPWHVVERVLREPSERSIGHQVHDCSIMIADLVGFTAMCERLAAEGPAGLSRLSRILNGMFERILDDAIFPSGGYVVQFTGDAVTAFFDGPEHARRAASAALATQRLMHGEVGRLLGGKSRELMLRIGVASGRVVLAVLGDLTRRVVVCAGHAPRRALALQQLAEPNTILIDKDSLSLLGGDVEVVDRHDTHATLRGVRALPVVTAPPALQSMATEKVEEKIALLEPFVPQPLAHRLRTTPRGWRIEGELRRVVVLFAEIGEEGAPLVDLELAEQVSRSVLRAFRRYEGIIAKADLAEHGHRILVLFGLHEPSENDCERALLAALESVSRVRSVAAGRTPAVTVKVGLHIGQVYFGAIGSDLKHDITVVGDAVNVAARCTSAAGPSEVVATDAVMNEAFGEFHASDKGPIRVKGKSEPVRVHVVHAPMEGRSHFMRTRQHTRFVAGRRKESGALLELAERALAGHGAVVGVCGEAGTGKSFLLANAVDRWTSGGGAGVLGRCRYATRSVPLAPVVTMFENFLGITAHDTEVQRRERIRKGLSPFNLADGAPELVALLEPVRRADGSTEALVDLADSHAQERVLASITQFIEQRVRQEPVFYICEDMHLADTLTMQLAMRLTHIGRRWPFLFLGTYRPDPLMEELRRIVDHEVTLPTLGVAEVGEIVCNERRAVRVQDELAVFLWQRSSGNPGYLMELLRFLGERELLGVRAGLVVAQPSMEELLDIVPQSLAHVALVGLGALGEVERRVLRMASAIGPRFDRSVLERVASETLDPDLFDSAVATLEAERIISPEQSSSAGGFVFRDDVTRVVTYNTIPDTERREVHARVADALERLAPGEAARNPAIIAYHRERSGSIGPACAAYEMAARLAMRAALDRECASFVDAWERVAARAEGEEAPAGRQRARMGLLKLVATARQGAPAETVRLAKRLASEHPADLDESATEVLAYWLGDALLAMGKPEKARERLESVARSSQRATLRCDAARLVASSYERSCDFGLAAEWLVRAERDAAGDDYRVARVALANGALLATRGDLRAAREVFGVVRDATCKRDHVLLCAGATSGLGRCALLERDFAEAERCFEDAMQRVRSVGRWLGEAAELANLGEARLWAGRAHEAREPLERAGAVAAELGDEATVVRATVCLGLAVALTQDPSEGAALCEDGARRAVRAGLRQLELLADLHAFRVAELVGDVERTESARRRALTHASVATAPLFATALASLERAGPAQ